MRAFRSLCIYLFLGPVRDWLRRKRIAVYRRSRNAIQPATYSQYTQIGGALFKKMFNRKSTRIDANKNILVLILILSLFSIQPPLAQAGSVDPVSSLSTNLETEMGAIDFYRDILPVLQAQCLPCHNQTRARAQLNLETPARILEGGDSGPAVIPGKPSESLLFQSASHQVPDLIMPPSDNKVNARNLMPDELARLWHWINQGALDRDPAKQDTAQGLADAIPWQPIPKHWVASYATALSQDGELAAIARANRVSVYRTATGDWIGELEDPELDGATQRDVVGALTFSPDNQWLVTAGYREVRFWQQQPVQQEILWSNASDVAWVQAAFSEDNNHVALVQADGHWEVREVLSGKRVASWHSSGGGIPQAFGTFQANDSMTEPETQTIAQGELEPGSTAKYLGDPKLLKQEQNLGHRLAWTQLQLARVTTEIGEGEKVETSVREQHAAALKKQEAHWVELREKEMDWQRKLELEPDAAGSLLGPIEKARIALEGSTRDVALAEQSLARTTATLSRARAESSEIQALIPSLEEELEAVRLRRAQAESLPLILGKTSAEVPALLTALPDGITVRWDTRSGHATDTFHLSDTNAVPLALCSTKKHEHLAVLPHALVRFRTTRPWQLHLTIGSTDSAKGPFSDRVQALAFSPDGTLLATGGGEPSRGGEIHIWRVDDGSLFRDLGGIHSDSVMTLAFSPKGDRLASGGADRFGRITSLNDPGSQLNLEGHTHHVLGVAWLADGSALATAGAEGVVKVWNPTTGERQKNVDGFGKAITGLLAVGLNAEFVAISGTGHGRVFRSNGEKLRDLDPAPTFLQSLGVTRDGAWVAGSGDDGILRLWNVANGKSQVLGN